MELHETDLEISDLKKKLETGELGQQWAIKKGVLSFKDHVYLSEDSDFIPIILQQYHDMGHEGF